MCCTRTTYSISTTTTRNPDRNQLLLASGADQVFIDTGSVAEQGQGRWGPGVSTKCSDRYSQMLINRHVAQK
jgi:hypothetical protein